MIRQVRVILSAEVDRFTGGIRNALSTFQGLVSGVASGARGVISFLSDIGNIVSGLAHGFGMLGNAVRGLWDMFIGAAISEERLGMTMKFLTGSAETGAAVMERLDEWVLKTGSDSDDAESAILDMAKALRATDGSVDPDKLFKTMDLIKRLSLVSGESMTEMSKIVGRALTGDVEMLARTLGISKEKLAELSPEFAKFVQNTQLANDTQLGAVTKIGSETEQIAGDALKALEEITTGLGGTQQALDEYANSTEGNLERAEANWEQFKEKIGLGVLPTINKALETFNNFVAEHPEEIQAFVDSISDFTAKGWDDLVKLVTSAEFKKFLSNLGDFSAKQWEKWVDAIQSVKWENVANAINAASNFVNFLAGNNPDVPKEDRAIDLGILGGISGPKKREDDWKKDFTWENLFSGLGLKPPQQSQPQQVEVKISVDDDGKIQAYTKKVVDASMEELVKATTAGNKQHGEQQ